MTIKYDPVDLRDERPLPRRGDGKLWHYTSVGSYPIIYFTRDESMLCAACANGENDSEASETHEDEQWRLVAHDILWEGVEYCDHCNEEVHGAYYDAEEEKAAE